MNAAISTKTPWHLWLVGIVGLAWNSFGCFDYFMSKTRGDAWLEQAGMTAAQIEHFNAMPAWMTAVWAVGVWGALAGTILLLVRSRFAFEVFCASLIAYVASLVYAYAIAPMPEAPANLAVMQGVILLGCLFFAWYAWAQRRAGVLR
jgi:Na+-translocating ferredoxin:NAD+ oxidoreductase RnfD subunit